MPSCKKIGEADSTTSVGNSGVRLFNTYQNKNYEPLVEDMTNKYVDVDNIKFLLPYYNIWLSTTTFPTYFDQDLNSKSTLKLNASTMNNYLSKVILMLKHKFTNYCAFSPRFFKPGSLDHDINMHVYAYLIALRPKTWTYNDGITRKRGMERGRGVPWMVPEWNSSAREMACVRDIQRVDTPCPLAPLQKDTQQIRQEPEYTKRRRDNREGEDYEQGTGGHV